MEFKARDIRKEFKKEGKTSYDEICKKYEVRMDFVERILGSEERERQ